MNAVHIIQMVLKPRTDAKSDREMYLWNEKKGRISKI